MCPGISHVRPESWLRLCAPAPSSAILMRVHTQCSVGSCHRRTMSRRHTPRHTLMLPPILISRRQTTLGGARVSNSEIAVACSRGRRSGQIRKLNKEEDNVFRNRNCIGSTVAGWIPDVPHGGFSDPYLACIGVGFFCVSLFARQNFDCIANIYDAGCPRSRC